MKTYTYDPERINRNGVDRMRFELGDSAVEKGAATCVLCDEEYRAIIERCEKEGRSWTSIKIQCLKAIVMKLAYETNYSVGKMSLDLSKRYQHFKEELEILEKRMQAPLFSRALPGYEVDDGHYFYLGMQDNPKAK